jgi:hypothetical protein
VQEQTRVGWRGFFVDTVADWTNRHVFSSAYRCGNFVKCARIAIRNRKAMRREGETVDPELYEKDFYEWALKNAELMRQGDTFRNRF